MFGFGKNKYDKDLERWQNEHIDLPHDSYCYDSKTGIERDKFGNPRNINSQIVNKVNEMPQNKVVGLPIKQDNVNEMILESLKAIERTLRVLAMGEAMSFRLTKEQIAQLDKMVDAGIYKSRSEAVRDAVENLKDNGN